ncbi:MAG: MOSC domain-containing protein [Myxococcales bacterium]|nr:MOSC domain-containing protein [Myxococcales bacterium]
MPQEKTLDVLAVLCGRIAPLAGSDVMSAMHKTPVEGKVYLDWEGLQGDEQANREHHGGRDKALHHYPFDHYAAWKEELPQASALLDAPGAFGENLSTMGWCEKDICLGDIFRWGEAFLQVSQARQPCLRLNLRFGEKKMARMLQNTGRTGWYYRVLTPGWVSTQEPLVLEKRPSSAWPLARVHHILYEDTQNAEALMSLRALPWLSESWRRLANKRLQTNTVEDWSGRLGEKS